MLLRERMEIVGLMPERALLRLKREGISLYNVKKTQKNAILFTVKRKDVQKVFAIYPNVCYNSSTNGAYRARLVGAVGLAKIVDFCTLRRSFLLGALLFCVLTLGTEDLVLGVEVVGEPVYRREVLQALNERGIKPYAFYKAGSEDLVTADLLSLDGVSFCSVKKIGRTVRVEIRKSPFPSGKLTRESMTAKHEGIIVSIAILRGTPMKKIGEKVGVGEVLVANHFTPEGGEQVCVEPIARVRIACAYEGVCEGAESEEVAFARAYLALGLEKDGEIVNKSIELTNGGYLVKIEYEVTETWNL